MSQELDEALDLIRNYKLEEALELLEQLILNDPNNLEILLPLAKLHSRTQKYGVAMNYFQKVLEIEPQNSEAITGLQLIKNILQLTNNYYYENPYTDEDLYESES